MKTRFLYLGKRIIKSNKVEYLYNQINNENSIVKTWVFSKKLFRKGVVGALYECEVNNSTVSYNKNEIPTYLIGTKGTLVSTFLKFPFLNEKEAETKHVDLVLKNSKRPETNLDKEIDNLRRTYKSLPSAVRMTFITQLIYNITK